MRNLLTFVLMTSLAAFAGCGRGRDTTATNDTGTTATSALAAGATAAPPVATVKVTLKFNGIVHLHGNDPNHRTVLVPNLTKAHVPHFPLLLAEPKYVVNSLPQSRIQTLNNVKTEFQYTQLKPGIDIDLVASKLKPRGRLDFSEAGDKNNPPGGAEEDCPSGNNKQSLHWLPRLAVALGDPTIPVKKQYLLPNPSTDDLVTRVEIEDGRMTAEAGTTSYAYAVNGNQTHHQALSSFLNYDFDAELDSDGHFTLMGKSFDGTTAIPIATFKPDGNAIVIYVANTVENDFFDPPATLHTLLHLDLYFQILETNLPVPTSSQYGTCSGVGNVDCGPDRTGGG